nr:hypothetical protein [Actinomycetota bacterium]
MIPNLAARQAETGAAQAGEHEEEGHSAAGGKRGFESAPDEEAMPECSLSLHFNQEEFCDGLYVHRKTLAFAVFAGSGALFEGRVAFGSA